LRKLRSHSRAPRPTRSLPTFTSLYALALLCLLLVGLGDASEGSCPLTCANGGQCRLQGAIKVATSDGASPSSPTATSFYCKCPRGFWGPSCEIQLVMCPSRNDTCYNGEPCYRDIDHDGEPYYRCQCDISSRSSTDMASPYTYRLCAHAATTFCNRPSDGSTGKGGGQDVTLGPSGGSYCANAGRCKSPVRNDTLHPGCDCPAEWTGNFCEVPVGYEAQAAAAEKEAMGAKNESTAGAHRSWGSVLWGVLSGLAILLVGLAIMYWWYIGFDDLFDAVRAWLRPSQDLSQAQDRPRRSRAGARRRRRRRQQRRDVPEVEMAPTKATKASQDDAMGETDEDSDDDIDDEEQDNGVHENGCANA
jgi:hypothetical protein